MRAKADKILDALAAGAMPCDGAWPTEQVELFRRWVQMGCSHDGLGLGRRRDEASERDLPAQNR